ncbi:dipeptidase E [Marininema mesophilum]|uniref:Dipeptidase E n=1 Tax=Marininema mesophilum TaxID=1048340 RepID=A0A1H3BDX6_9BACL|nr:peptidase E [Marininema mesophilum]SDX39851.1 dipeptidase E [Marininema mesophilum]
MQRKLILIGGGWLESGSTKAIDSYAVKLTNKKSPLALFIPTASGDEEEYITSFHNLYGAKLGCHTEVLRSSDIADREYSLRKTILDADLLYLGGGNYIKMLAFWQKHRVDSLIQEAWKKGKVIVGISAGAICWFEKGLRSNYEHEGEYILSEGWGIIPTTICPHFNQTDRRQAFLSLSKMGTEGLALEDDCGLAIIDDQFQLLTRSDTKGAWYIKHGAIYSMPSKGCVGGWI